MDVTRDNPDQPERDPSTASPEPAAVTATIPEATDEGNGLAPHYVVGIGASAGGLEAIERFFDNVPLNCGLSFVLVQHLSPDFKSLMDELLARHTKIAIHRVQHGMPIERDAIYLIPPKTNMMLSDGRLWLSDQEPKLGPNLPIDIFLRSLAQSAGNRAIAVILSGTGSDGSRGVREVHEKGGLVVAQDPDTAGFDGMPKAAIGTGVVDLVLAPEAMPGRILQYIGHPDGLASPDHDLVEGDDLSAVFSLLRRRFAVDFTLYKAGTIGRRLERRMSLNAFSTLAEYVKHLESIARSEIGNGILLYRDLLVEVTRFFRDRAAFDIIEGEVVPRLFEQARWTTASGSGSPAARPARRPIRWRSCSMPIGSPRSFPSISRSSPRTCTARRWTSPPTASTASTSSPTFPRRSWRVTSSGSGRNTPSAPTCGRWSCSPHNVAKDPPFTRLDLITCRNLLIYLNPATQKRVLSLFQFGLKTGGFLFLGPSESMTENDGEFETTSERWKIFRKRRDARPGWRLGPFQSSTQTTELVNRRLAGATPPRSELAFPAVYEALLSRFVPSGLLIDEDHQLLHAFGTARQYLRLPEGRTTNDVLRMVDDDLRMAISSAVHRAGKERTEFAYSGVKVSLDDRELRLRVTAVPLPLGRFQSMIYFVRIEPDQPAEPRGPGGPVVRCPGRVRRSDPRARAGAGLHEGTPPDHHRGAGGQQRGAPVHQRGARRLQRGAPVHQRGTPLGQRGAVHGQRGVSEEDRRAHAAHQRHRQPAAQHRHRHGLPRHRPEHPQVHPGHRPGLQPPADGRRPPAQAHLEQHPDRARHA